MSKKIEIGQRVMLTQHDVNFGGQTGTVTAQPADPHYLIVETDRPIWTGSIVRNQKEYRSDWAVRKSQLQPIDTCRECNGTGEHVMRRMSGEYASKPCDACEGYGHTGGPFAADLDAHFTQQDEAAAERRNEEALYGCR